LTVNNEITLVHHTEKAVLLSPEIHICSRDFANFGINIHSPLFYKKNDKGDFIEEMFLLYNPFYISWRESKEEFKEFLVNAVKKNLDKYFDALFETEIYLPLEYGGHVIVDRKQ